MIAEDIIKFIEDWAPPGIAWDEDNVGLQVGSPKRRVSNIFLCLELTPKALEEAISQKANFIFTHHPFIFQPLKKINTQSDPKGKLIEKLIKNEITLFSAHTNLDFTKEGVSFELARQLKLQDTQFLLNEKGNQYKVTIFVPDTHLEKLSDALFNEGAGIIGEYKKCSFSVDGKGSFEGSEKTDPFVGKKSNVEHVEEVRFEIIVDAWKLNEIVRVIHKAHPYEEPAFDIYPIENVNKNFGFGVIGELEKSLTANDFLKHVCKSLKTNNLRYTKGTDKKIKKVAVCGGSGSRLLETAISKKADAFITADLKYHTFQDGENRILFVDAGHYETEIHSLNAVKRKLNNFIKNNGGSEKVLTFRGTTNPIKFFNNKGVK